MTFENIDETWGIKTTEYNYPQKSKPKFRDIIRRIRNSLGHSNFYIELSNKKSYPQLFDEAIIHFSDINMNDPTDTFSIALKVSQLKIFYGRFRDAAFKSILEAEGKEVGMA